MEDKPVLKHFPKIRGKLTREQKDAANARQRRYRKLYPERWQAYRRKHYESHKEAYIEAERSSRFRRRFGITPKQYDEMFASQLGLCKICGRPERSLSTRGDLKKLAVDHDHTTGKIRALLCAKCNQAIGLLDDNPDLLYKAALYVEDHGRTKACA